MCNSGLLHVPPAHDTVISILLELVLVSSTRSGVVLVLCLFIWSDRECGVWLKISLCTNLELDM